MHLYLFLCLITLTTGLMLEAPIATSAGRRHIRDVYVEYAYLETHATIRNHIHDCIPNDYDGCHTIEMPRRVLEALLRVYDERWELYVARLEADGLRMSVGDDHFLTRVSWLKHRCVVFAVNTEEDDGESTYKCLHFVFE